MHPKTIEHEQIHNEIIFHGHHHKSKYIFSDYEKIIHIPTLSNMNIESTGALPGFITCDFSFDKGVIKVMYISNYVIINNSIYKTNETKLANINKKQSLEVESEYKVDSIKKLNKKFNLD